MSMELQLTATEKITKIDGVECRVWDGVTAGGTKCIVFVHRIAVHEDEDADQFDQLLVEQLPPGQVFSLRDVLP